MNSKVSKKIKLIEDRVPQEWRDALMCEQYVAPDLREEVQVTMKELQEEGNIKEYLRLKHLFDAGYYDAKEAVVDQEVAKKIEDFIDVELDKAIESGELPKPKDDKGLQKVIKKLKRNEKRKQK